MRNSVYDQFAIVCEDSASLFNQKLNEEIYRLRENNPVVKFSESIPFYAQIKYKVNEQTPETIAEASEAVGVSFVCAQCPEFKYAKRNDGEENRACKWGDCDFTELGRTRKDSPACEELYRLIKEGSVKLCYRD